MNSNNITCVSGYWDVKNKYGKNKYTNWFKNTLSINQKYIFFCNKKDIPYIREFRKNKETSYIDYPIQQFYTNRYVTNAWVHPAHVPSKELGMIWNEKIHLVKLAKDQDTNPTDFYIWVDAGVAPYRENAPPSTRLNLKNVNDLPHDKLCYSWVAEDYHNMSGTVLIMHKNIIDEFHDKYYTILEKYNDGWKGGSDQYILTQMMNIYPELFYKMSEGYGQNLIDLYKSYI